MSNDNAPRPFEPMGFDLPEMHPGVTFHDMLDFNEPSEDILLMLLDLPHGIVDSAIELCSGYDAAVKTTVARMIADTAKNRDGKTFEDVAGIVHHAVVVAPVYTAFANTGSRDVLESTITMMRQLLEQYWRCDPSGFRLDAHNRFYFARGIALFMMVSERPLQLSWKNDKHFTWIGSRFDELKPYAAEIISRQDLTRPALEEMSLRWTKPYRRYDGTLDQRFEMEHYDRLLSYDDYYSVIPEDGWEHMQAALFRDNGSFRLNLDFRGVTLESRQHMYLQHFYPDLNEAPFMSVLSSLSDGTGNMENGEAAMMMRSFGIGTLAFMDEVTEDYTISQRRLVSNALNRLAVRSDALDNTEMLEHFALYVSTAAPLLEEFFEHKDRIAGNDILSLLGADDDWDTVLENSGGNETDEELEQLLWDHIELAFASFHRVIDAVEITPEKYQFLARGVTAVSVVGYVGSVTEDEVLFIGSHHDTILKNAETLKVTKDLRSSHLNELAREDDEFS